MTEALARVLCVDDEPNLLLALQRSLHELVDVTTAGSGQEGLEILRTQDPFAVVVSDMRMPGMGGAEFLARAREASPDAVRILLTGQADTHSAVDAVNRGAIFRFLCKPCSREQLHGALRDAVAQHRLVLAERDLLENTLRQAINALAEVLAMTMPWAQRRASFAQTAVRHALRKLGWPDAWQYEVAAALCQIGCIGVPPEIVQRELAGRVLDDAESARLASHSETGFRLLASIPRMERVAAMVRYQNEPPPGAMPPEVVRGAALLRAALELERLHARGVANAAATTALAQTIPPLPREIAAALADFRGTLGQRRSARVRELVPGWVVDEDVRTPEGKLLLSRGHELSEAAIAALRRLADCHAVSEPICVRCDATAP